MHRTHFETRVARRESRALLATRRGFTLTELLVVITIIAILASLVTGAAIRALNRAKQAAITLELQQLAMAIENFKVEYGGYPPNAITPPSASASQLKPVRSDLQRALKKAFPRINSGELAVINKLIGDSSVGGPVNAGGYLQNGLSGGEAIVFWLSGFSKDPALPLSGTGGPSYVPADGFEVLENRNWADGFEFDLGSLGPRDSSGQFNGRYIEYTDPTNVNVVRRINFWTYSPKGSQQHPIYFDTSNITPEKRFNTSGYNFELKTATDTTTGGSDVVYALRQPLETVTVNNPGVAQTKFVNQGKFQILHCGIDDNWGDFSSFSSDSGINSNTVTATDGTPQALLFPTGPFIGDVADTVSHFYGGTLEDEQK
jgi:prepilin-type N-terminal cleavage/methylation domain-containing protein